MASLERMSGHSFALFSQGDRAKVKATYEGTPLKSSQQWIIKKRSNMVERTRPRSPPPRSISNSASWTQGEGAATIKGF